jgi:hypothetical protein
LDFVQEVRPPMRPKPRRFPRRFATVSGAGCCLLWTLALPLGSGLPASTPRGGSAASALTAFKEPQSGRFVAPREGALTKPGQLLLRRLDRSQAGLVEERGETAAGGVRLDLRGRFASALVARRDASGHLTLECTSAPPTASAAAEAGEPAVGAPEGRAEPSAGDPE